MERSENMNIKVYEDQTGLMVFPENRPQKDESVVKLFHNKVDLFVKKTGNNLEIDCYILAHKGLARDLGYYIIYTNFYNDAIFTNFKKDTDKILQDLKLQVSYNNPENIIFDNIEKFDPKLGTKLDYGYGHNIDVVKNVVGEGKHLEYTTGDINEISIFCRDILKKINNVEIYITSGDEIELGNINISRKKNEKLFYPSESTKQILNEYEKKEGEKLGKAKIAEGFSGPIKDGIDMFKNLGRDPTDSIIGEMNKVVDMNKIYNTLANKINNGDETKKEGLGIISKIFIFLIILVIGIVIGVTGQLYFEGKLSKYIENPTIIMTNPIATSTPTVTTNPTTVSTPKYTTPVPTNIAPISNSTQISTNGTQNLTNSTKTSTNGTQNLTNSTQTSTNLTILNSYPNDTVINGSVGKQITFSITTNQLAGMTWRVNGEKKEYYQNLNTSNYTIMAPAPGILTINVTADTLNSSASIEWKWNITKG